jgi:hypothetical protein
MVWKIEKWEKSEIWSSYVDVSMKNAVFLDMTPYSLVVIRHELKQNSPLDNDSDAKRNARYIIVLMNKKD